ncbi:MAG: energy transducer TonB, partial [Lysobacter sp.]
AWTLDIQARPVVPEPVFISYSSEVAPPPSPAVDSNTLNRRPKRHSGPPPKYPQAAACAGVHGTVVLVLTIDSEGRLAEKKIERSSLSLILDHTALEATNLWRFDPEIRRGQPVTSRIRVPVDFVLPATPVKRCTPSVELRRGGSKKASRQFASSDRIEAELSQYVFVPTAVVVSWRRTDANGQSAVTIHQERRRLEPSETFVHQQFLLPDGTIAGDYQVVIDSGGKRLPPAAFKIK